MFREGLTNLCILLMCVLAISPAHAQVHNNSAALKIYSQNDLKQMLYTSMLKEIGVPRESEVGRRLAEMIFERKSPTNSFRPETDNIIHRIEYDSGVGHTAFDPGAMIAKFESRRDAVKAKLIEKREKLVREPRAVAPKAMAKLRAMFVPQPIGKCTEDETKRYPFRQAKNRYQDSLLKTLENTKKGKKKKKQNKNAHKIDILILPQDVSNELVQTHDAPEKLFGHSTFVHKYSTESGDALSLQASRAKIKCLPYRVRVKGEKKYIHYGEDALMNYDGKKGEFHPQVKRRLYEFR